MPARLIYHPKAYVYTKSQSGQTYNLTNYVTAGQVNRVINQVSTAQVTLRNPYKLFTGGQGQPRVFHPMDPITIYLERVAGYPVRVFTGYLDHTPYYQMYPGAITLQASCTLKRLLYTFFDPSLPYVISFFEKYGWVNTGSGSIISKKAFTNTQSNKGHGATQSQVDSGAKPFTDLQDGSLGKLLWAILYDIGEWKDSNIYIENLPTGSNGIAARMQALMKSIQAGQKEAATEYTDFLNKVIGASAYGTGGGLNGGGGSGPVWQVQASNESDNVGASNGCGGNNQPVGYSELSTNGNAIGASTPVSQLDYAALGHIPCGTEMVITNVDKSSAGYGRSITAPKQDIGNGSSGKYPMGLYPGVISALGFPSGISTGPFTVQIQLKAGGNLTVASGFGTQIATTNPTTGTNQGTGGSLGQAGGQKVAGKSNNPTTPTHGFRQSTLSQTTSTKTTKPSGTGSGAGNTAGQSFGGYVNPLSKCTGLNSGRVDMGVDYSVSADSPILALGNGHITFASNNDPGWPGNGAVVFQLSDGPFQGKYIYYAEHITVTKMSGTVSAGEPLCTLHPGDPNIEMGWASGSGASTLATALGQNGQQTGQSSDVGGVQSAAGVNFNELLMALGAPSGTRNQPMSTGPGMPANWPSVTGITGGTPSGTTGGGGQVTSASNAQAFVAELNFPSVQDQVAAIALGAEHKGLMHDQNLMPFVQQVAQASLRSFQSLPNGDFFAFYPDYFGEMGHHDPYWLIHDIEILQGGIDLSDDSLATHVFAVGDNTWPVNNELLNQLFSAGAINIFNAFVTTDVVDTSNTNTKSKNKKNQQHNPGLTPGIMNAAEAVAFIQRYGARPLVQDYPMVRSPIFEMLLAYQQFMLAWSNQFMTPFTFTFMPELFPGGKVGFPDHGIQMYISSVTHQWDYAEGGFTTSAQLSAPSLLSGVNAGDFPDLPPHMVTALVDPVKGATAPTIADQAGFAVEATGNTVPGFTG